MSLVNLSLKNKFKKINFFKFFGINLLIQISIFWLNFCNFFIEFNVLNYFNQITLMFLFLNNRSIVSIFSFV